jgi:dipeptidyl aminopeptidase/acylaminoacyl peptidase
MKTVKRIFLFILLIIIIGYGYATWFFSGEIVAFTPATSEEMSEVKKFNDLSAFGVTPQEISFETSTRSDTKTGDTLTLSGWFIPGKSKNSPTFVVLHGKGDTRIGSLKYSGMLSRAGYNVLAYDHRHHGASEGTFSTYGFYEGYDVSAAIDYLESRGDCNTERLGILGESFGGATAIMAASIDPRITILIEDSSYPDLPTVVSDYGKMLYGLPRFPLVDSALLVAGLRAHFSPFAVSPLTAIANVTVPTLIIHCDGDADIKPLYSEWMYDASGAEVKELHFFSGCTHTRGYEDHTEEYERLVLDFISRNMP